MIESLGPAGLTTTLTLPFLLRSAELVAVTVTLVSAVTAGAVTTPAFETEPALTLQMTAVLLVPCTVALNCWLFPEAMRIAPGEIAILMSELAPARMERISTKVVKIKEF